MQINKLQNFILLLYKHIDFLYNYLLWNRNELQKNNDNDNTNSLSITQSQFMIAPSLAMVNLPYTDAYLCSIPMARDLSSSDEERDAIHGVQAVACVMDNQDASIHRAPLQHLAPPPPLPAQLQPLALPPPPPPSLMVPLALLPHLKVCCLGELQVISTCLHHLL